MKTRRELKHEMLLAFMANVKAQQKRSAPVAPKLLKTLLSFFL
jgi:hypothetical protein